MKILPPRLPYAFGALEPVISRSALQLHFERHHWPCYENVLQRVTGTDLENHSLGAIVRAASHRDDCILFRDAVLAWNHDFFWKSMCCGGGGAPTGLMLAAIQRTYGSFDAFVTRFRRAALGRLATGWLWVTWRAGRVHLVTTSEADTPVVRGHVPLLVVDLWEHAYYLDYQDQKGLYADLFLAQLANWDFAQGQLRRLVAAARSALNLARAGIERVWPSAPH
ncbi:MAG: superoxide dismutase [Steroidobacteraceae bacterium]